MNRRTILSLAASSLMLASTLTPAWAQDTVKLPCVCELSGAGAAAGTNYRDGAKLAVEEINATGGILGKQIEMTDYDTATDPQTSRALVQKAIDDGAYVIIGTVYSGSTIVNMLVAQQAGIPQFTGAEAPNITQGGNPFIFRTAYGAQKGVPALTGYFKDTLKVTKIGVAWVNNDFGKGGRDVFVTEMAAAGIEIVADVPSEQGQADFAADVSKLKESGAEAVFVYLNEEESARILAEAKKQGLTAPMVGEVTLTGQKVIDLAGEAAEGAIAHVGLTSKAPVPAIQEFAAKFNTAYGRETDHNGIKGYTAVYATKYVTEMVGSFDGQAFADKMHGITLKAAEYPGMLLDTSWDDTGELSRESFMIKVEGGQQVVVGTIPAN
ncbi:MAG: ABC transporter substrate-binding protein [Pseudomonadota bacterium]